MSGNQEIIKRYAEIELPQDLIEEIDLKKMGDSLSKQFKKVDDFKNFKDEWDNKGFFGKLWGRIKGEPNKHRDAAIINQGDLLKMIAELTVLNTIFAKELNRQQKLIDAQQKEIIQQNIKLEAQQKELEKQQKGLEEQNNKLDEQQKRILELVHLTDEQEGKIKNLLEKAEKLHELEKITEAKIGELKNEFKENSNKFQYLEVNLNAKIESAISDTAKLLEEIKTSNQNEYSKIYNSISSNIQDVLKIANDLTVAEKTEREADSKKLFGEVAELNDQISSNKLEFDSVVKDFQDKFDLMSSEAKTLRVGLICTGVGTVAVIIYSIIRLIL